MNLFFVYDEIPRQFRWAETLVVVLILPLTAAVSVWFACASLIRIPAIRLLQGEQSVAKQSCGTANYSGYSKSLV